MGLTDDAQAKKYYYDFVRFIVRNANLKESIELPDLGTFQIILHKARRINTRGLDGADSEENHDKIIPQKRLLKFYVDRKLKKYIDNYLQRKMSDVL